MNRRVRSSLRLAGATVLFGLASSLVHAQVSLTTLGTPATQNFDSLVTSGTANPWADNSTIPGWYAQFSATPANPTTYRADSGGANTGAIYSWGVAGTNALTERAFGMLSSGTPVTVLTGVRYVNNTGATITSLQIAYNGEQWRDGGAAAPAAQSTFFEYQVANAGVITDANTPTTGWLGASSLDIASPTFTNTGAGAALDGNLPANRVAKAATLAVTVNPGQEVWLRWRDPNDAGNDHGLAIDDLSVTPQGGGPVLPTLSIGDVSLTEGNPPGTTTFTFPVTLSAPAGAGGVSFDIATADGTATDDNPVTEDNDYVAQSLTGQSISAGSSGPYNFSVTVNRDTVQEPNETFLVNVTNVVGATVADGQGQGTITNDDISLTPIHDIQGPGASSPIVGSVVNTRGIVTGVRVNGFFIQEPDATVDADPATSEGIFVFTSAAPPAAAALGNLVQVSATVTEFVPAQDVLQPPLTELTSPTVNLVSSGNPLPAAIPLTATFPDPAGPHDQLERLEGMRVSIASLTVGAPTGGNINEANATATSNGVFFGTITGVPRAFREPGIQAPDPAPQGTIPPIPRWDANPELLRVDSDGLTGGAAIDVSTGAVVTGLVGPLDYTFRRYTLLPDPASSPVVTGGMGAVAVTAPTASEVTIASYNLQRFFDTVNDPGIGEPVLTAVAFDARLARASLGIRDYLRTPDILGIVEVENLSTLQALAARISSDAIAASQPDPQYDAFLVEGNDVGGIDVGFLVKSAEVAAGTPRVEVVEVVQENDGELFVNADSSTELLNDRPPLRLNAIVNSTTAPDYPVTVIVNHLRSLNDSASIDPGSSGWTTLGERVRAKRQAQAASLANLVQARQTADPAERIALVGDFNAFEFNDGLGDSLGTILGTPSADNQTAVPGDGVDLVTPDLVNLEDSPPPSERYSFVFDGNAQTLDHMLVNQELIDSTTTLRIEHARINADFPQTARNGAGVLRLADHDPVVAFLGQPQPADLEVTVSDAPDPVLAGEQLTYTITVSNLGAAAASTVTLADTLPVGTTFASLAVPAGWSCTSPAVGAGGTVNCSIASLAPGSAVFTLVVDVGAAVASGTVLSNSASATTTTIDANPANDTGTATTTVATSADLGVTVTDAPDPIVAGNNLAYTITVTNAGPSNAAAVSLSDTLPVGTSFVSLSSPAGWSCTTPAVGAGGTVSCSQATLAPGSSVFTLTVAVDGSVAGGTVLSDTATVASTTSDPASGNESATATTTVGGASADLAVTITDTPDPVAPATAITYAITVTNDGPGVATTVNLATTVPANTSFASFVAPAGWSCTTPAIGAGGSVDCTIAALAVGNAAFTLTVQVDGGAAGATISANVAVSSTNEGAPGDETASTTTVVGSGSADLSVTIADSPDPVAPGGNITYAIAVANAGPTPAADAGLDATLPAGTTFVSLTSDPAWSCSTPAVGATGTVSCARALMPIGSAAFSLVVAVDAGTGGGTIVTQSVALDSSTPDPDAVDRSASTTTTVIAAGATLSASKTATGQFRPGGNVTYQIVVQNHGPGAQPDLAGDEFVDVLPAGLTLQSATSTSGSAVANIGTGTVTWNGSLAAGGSVTITIQAAIGNLAPGTRLENQAQVFFDANGDGTNEASATSDDPGTAAGGDATGIVLQGIVLPAPAIVPASSTWTQLLLAAMLMLVAGGAIRRRG